MTEYNQTQVSRILNPTSIDLGEYVINPFLGCEFGCLYCYVRSNRVVARNTRAWGSYVDVRVNAAKLLEKELQTKKPKTVLLGSTTECFQPQERKYRLTQQILEILNRNKVYYVILTRSPDILDCLDILAEGFCKRIYFTVNNFEPRFKAKLEPKSPDFKLRDQAVKVLHERNIPVVPYFSALVPWVSDVKGVFERFDFAETIEFEGLNFNLKNIQDIVEAITQADPGLAQNYQRMLTDADFYHQSWQAIKADIARQAQKAGKKYNIYLHKFGAYFQNQYK